uniref:TonB-dependent receptor domain-containing protein n=1 Tax=uncultured Draconibacterium sp. TaxID=1573823 RepID=UPI0032170A6D
MRIIRFISGIRLICIVLFVSMIWVNSYAQQKTIQLVDKNSQKAIADVFYRYNNKTGFTDTNGTVTIQFAKGSSLFLSHIQYGKIQVNPAELATALENGKVEIQESSNHLMPVTLVQVQHGAGETSRMDISVHNKLAHDAGNLLEAVPGISSIRKSGAYGFDPVLRGFKYDQINMVLDGVQTASAACPNRMDPAASQIPINMISRAEVLKGPHSLRYGNAFGGTINFKSSSPDFKENTTPLGRLGTSYESNGNIFRTEGVAGVASQKIDLKFFGSYSLGKDYTDGDGLDVSANFNRLNWGGKLGFKLSETQTLGVLVSNNFAKDVDFPALPMDLREDNTWLINASHRVQFYDKVLSSWNTSVYGTMVNHLMDNFDKILEPRKVDAETDAKTRNYGGRTEFHFHFTNSFIYGGMDHRFESADGYRTRTMLMGPMTGKVLTDNVWQDAEVSKTGIFGEYHLDKSGFHLVVSGRLNFNSSKANNPADGFAGIYDDLESSNVHPSVSFGGTKLFNKTTSLGLWLGRSTRSPGISERYINQFPVGLDPYEMLGNPQLDPEINNQVDVVFQYQTEKTNVNVNLFASFLRDYISSEIREDLQPAMATSPGVRQFVNIDKALMSGFEISWKHEFSRYLSHDFDVVYTYGENQELEEPLGEIPPLELHYRLTGSFINEQLQPELMWRGVNKQDRIARSYGETKTPGFNVVDAKVTWIINKQLTAAGGVQNLFDEAYYEHLARSVRNVEARPIYSPGRSFYMTLTIQFL